MSVEEEFVPDTYEDEEGNYVGPVIELYIGMTYDARTHRIYTKAPTGWAAMSEEEREKFLEQEAETWAAEQLEIGGIVHDNVKTAVRDTRDYWGSGFSDDQLEDLFG